MGFFPDTIAAALRSTVVRCDLLVFFDFKTVPMRVWPGFGTAHTNDGNDWRGIGQLGEIGDLESSIGATAPQTSFTLSGVDRFADGSPVPIPGSLVADALDASDEVKDRDVTVYLQFFDEDFACLDNPFAVWAGLMDVMRVREIGPDQCTLQLYAETIFARRALRPLGNLSDRDQQRLYPGDVGLSFIPLMQSKSTIWPIIPAPS